MNFFKDLITSMKFNARERANNVYIGAFLLSWLSFNWRFLLIVIFGEGSMESRISQVDEYVGFFNWLFLPALLSALICFALPKINKIIVAYQNGPNDDVKEIIDASEIKSLKRLEEIERLRAKASSAGEVERAAQELEMQKLNQQIQESKDISDKLSEQVSNSHKEMSLMRKDYESLKLSLDSERNDNAHLKMENNNLKSALNELKESNNIDIGKYIEMSEKMSNLEDDNNRLKEKIKEMEKYTSISNKKIILK